MYILYVSSLNSSSSILQAVYPEWQTVIGDSNDLPTKGRFEPALAVVDGKYKYINYILTGSCCGGW